ncbi:HD domain-containing protein [Halarcobacter anaerophilus]|uniref:HD domain-containing protein n=1 Tax=Halarcobacter anaerophilus TaxID=877500 RepID=UPI001163609C|nr:HD domain-containing protein [Halarcobacter anaerophilus]QDF28570.1 HD superfamily phosphohydrolase [Halarcobacter anaerophilus]
MQSLPKEYSKGKNNIQNRIINDTIYNHIQYTKLEDKLLQTKIVNRLQFITQNALAYFSYPSITTKRFIHSLGTMHLSSFIFKNSLLNADKQTKDDFLKTLKRVVKNVIKDNDLNIKIDDLSYFDNKALYQFTIPTKNKKDRVVYTIILQTIRVVALLHDVGHLPFSHQVENSLKNVYDSLKNHKKLNAKQLEFKEFYEKVTQKERLVLHEAIGKNLLTLLLDYEVFDFITLKEEKDYIKLIKILSSYILENRVYKNFDFKVLHRIVDSTVDADRLDYINRDMLASGYITGPSDFIRITKEAVLVKDEKEFYVSYFDMGLIDIEHMLEMRFNLYKKVIFNHGIAKTDALLENVVQYLCTKYFQSRVIDDKPSNSISMLWKFFNQKENEIKLDIISMLDENWLITFFKNEYFTIKNKRELSQEDYKYKYCFEEVLFGKRFFRSPWKNLNEFYKVLGFTTVQRYQFRESFGYINKNRYKKLRDMLEEFILKYESKEKDLFFTYQIVSFKIGIEKDFRLYDGENIIFMDEISTVRKRLKQSMLNTVPFYIYSNSKELSFEMKEDLREILFEVFKD